MTDTKRRFSIFILCLFIFLNPDLIYSQNYKISDSIHWIQNKNLNLNELIFTETFENAAYYSANSNLPAYYKFLEIPENSTASIIFLEVKSVPVTIKSNRNFNFPAIPLIKSGISKDQGKCFLNFSFLPFLTNPASGQTEKVTYFKIQITLSSKLQAAKRSQTWKQTSVLASGSFYKIKISKSGVYKIDYNFLKSLGINPDQINPKNIKIYGNGGGTIPQKNSDYTIDDLEENAILVSGEDDNKFDKTDYILFYGKGPHNWIYDAATKMFRHQYNYFSDEACYFITIAADAGKRVDIQNSVTTSPDYTTSDYVFYDFHEKNIITEISRYVKSGRDWYGEDFNYQTTQTFPFNVPQINTAYKINVISSVAARSSVASTFSLNFNGNPFSQFVNSSNTSVYDADYLSDATDKYSFISSSDLLNLTYTYNKSTAAAIGWLNYIEINARAGLTFSGNQFGFRDTATVGRPVSEYQVSSGLSDLVVWDVTDIFNVKKQELIPQSGKFTFRLNDPGKTEEFIAFHPSAVLTPVAGGLVVNQNLHALHDVDMVIVVYPPFMDAAKKLADFHTKFDNLSVVIVTPEQVYNEFSSGTQDITAIRRIMKMLYDKAATTTARPKYLLLLGDASYDYNNLISNNTNFVPSFECLNSYSPIGSYTSDDYYGFLDDNEGAWDNGAGDFDKMDIAIGRLPVKSLEEANEVVYKIIHYKDNITLADWRNNAVFVSDDETSDFVDDTEGLTDYIEQNVHTINVSKIYIDAYQRITTSSGNTYPDVNKEINKRINAGTLIFNYMGHGSEIKLAHEKIVEINDINSWNNIDALSIFVTATCEFSRYDDPERVSAGEQVLLNPAGGAVAMLTTSREVFQAANTALLNSLYKDNMFKKVNGKYNTIGEIVRITKNRRGFDDNTRKFVLLGDPAMQIDFPEFQVTTDSINFHAVNSIPDTLKALSVATISGRITDNNGNLLNQFNGVLYPTVFDKVSELSTLNNNGAGIIPFSVRKNIIYKGKVSIKNGRFTFNFVVPKDISYKNGYGRISYYATNDSADANGWYENIIVGGTADSIKLDTSGPKVRVYMNDSNFIFGGITNQNPVLFAKITDENGINTVGNGIGHEIIGTLDGKDEFVLNQYYETVLNNYQEGEIHYPLYNLSEGRHTLKVKVWDVANNSGVGYTEFVVTNSQKIMIKNLHNYPNPFTDKTTFVFEHNISPQNIKVSLQIFNTTGKLIKTIEQEMNSEGSSIKVEWDGRASNCINCSANDQGIRQVNPGLYLCRLIVETEDGQTATASTKLILVR